MRGMPDSRLCKHVFQWAAHLTNVKNYAHTIKTFFSSLNLSHFARTDMVYSNSDLKCFDMAVSKADEDSWLQLIHKPEGNKLRTYCLFKGTFEMEPDVQNILSRQRRSGLLNSDVELLL